MDGQAVTGPQDNPPGFPRTEARAIHATRRAAERFGLKLDTRTLAAWRAKITSEAPDAVRLSNPGTVLPLYAIWHAGEWIPVIYDHQAEAVVTVLPKSILRQHKRRLPW